MLANKPLGSYGKHLCYGEKVVDEGMVRLGTSANEDTLKLTTGT